MTDILSEIIAHKRVEVASRKSLVPIAVLEQEFQKMGKLPFYSLKKELEESSSGIIAEFKRRSPSKGWLFETANVKEVAMEYASAGASALSVLTDEQYFGGTMDDLQQATVNVQVPVIRKEFIIDEYQLLEAKLAGASAVLLIAAALTVEECRRFTALAGELELEVLLELHDEAEIDHVGPLNGIVGVNNRNLGSFVTDLHKSFRMADLLPKETIWVSESGLSCPSVVKELRDAGYRGFLIGEHFMKSGEPGKSIKQFINSVAG